MFCYFGFPLAIRLVLLVVAVVAAAWIMRRFPDLLRAAEKAAARLGSRPRLAPAIVFTVSLVVNAALGALHLPEPSVHDEWAYLLAGDTYASGRLANPPHPHWRHFETYHVLSQPTYMAKYPPGTGLALAAGQKVAGLPVAGIWFAQSLALAALCWMLQAWMPGRWAFAGSLLLAINTPMLMAWGQSYWGGSIAFLGGCLVGGGLRRAVQAGRSGLEACSDGLAMGAGAVLLALSRPFEGAIVCALAAVVLGAWFVRQGSGRWAWACRAGVPAAVAGAAGLVFLLASNRAVTGDALTLPYTAHSRQYSATSIWIWRPLPELREYNLPRMKNLYVSWSRARQLEARTVAGWLELAGKKVGLLWSFFPWLGGICLLPCIAGWKRLDGWTRGALVVVAAVVLIELQMVNSYLWPHYVAPVAGLFYAVLLFGVRWWRAAGRHWPPGRLVLPVIAINSLLNLGAFAYWQANLAAPGERTAIEQQLAAIPGDDLVFVRYPAAHNLHEEWVYNLADIDSSPIVWANELSPDRNEELARYYRGSRKVWVWLVGQPASEALVPWQPANCRSSRRPLDLSTGDCPGRRGPR